MRKLTDNELNSLPLKRLQNISKILKKEITRLNFYDVCDICLYRCEYHKPINTTSIRAMQSKVDKLIAVKSKPV